MLVLQACVASAQTTLAVEGPWTGQAQCAITTRGPNYQGADPHVAHHRRNAAGPQQHRTSSAVWSVQGKGNRSVNVTGSTNTTEERWTISVPETSAPISVWEIPGYRGNNRIRIGSQHGLLVASNAIRPSTGSLAFSIQEWQFPAAEDELAKTTLSGTNTFTVPVGPGWRRPDKTPSTVTCTWNFTRSGAEPTATPQLSRTGITVPSRASATNPPTAQPAPSAGSVATPRSQPAARSGSSATPAGGSLIATGPALTGGGALVDPRPMKVCTTAAAPPSSATPGGVTFTLNRATEITGYRISRRDLGELTPSPIDALPYTHAAPLRYQTHINTW